VKKAPKAPKSQSQAGAKRAAKPAGPPTEQPPAPSPEIVKLADYINPRALDAAQMVMLVSAALQPKDGAPPALGEDVRAGLVRILQEVTEIIMGIKSQVSSAMHTATSGSGTGH
jgi:hypothetical protein